MYETFDYEMLEQLGTVATAGDAIFQIGRFALIIAAYVLRSIGLYAIAKRRGISNPWLAWIPVGQSWILGCISDQYQHVAHGQQKSKRKALLWLDLLTTVVGVITVISLFRVLLAGLTGVDMSAVLYGYSYESFYSMTDAQLTNIASSLMGVLGWTLVLLGMAIAKAIIYYMALYDLFRSCDPGRATAFTVLSIFLSAVVTGILVLVDRNKDLGMQPQNSYLPPQGWQDPWQQSQQGWQQPQQGWQQPQQGWQQPPQGLQQPQQPQDPWQNNSQW